MIKWTPEIRKVSDLKHWEKNPRTITKEAFEKLKERITKRGFHDVIKIDTDNTILSGNQRTDALISLGIEEVNVLIPDRPLTEEERDQVALESNRTDGKWDFDILANQFNLDTLKDVGFTEIELGLDIGKQQSNSGILVKKFMIPPFSIFDTKQGYWQDRKREWISYLGDSGKGRPDNLLTEGMKMLAQRQGGSETRLTGSSVFDPVLAEIVYKWFMPEGGSILDPFAGGSVRGVVAGHLGYSYKGIDLSKEQVGVNVIAGEILFPEGIPNEIKPIWFVGDAMDVNKIIPPDIMFDFILSCPPYGDLEQYSDDPNDLSNLEFTEMISRYRQIIKDSLDHLKENRFAVFVVGDYRDKKTGFYRNFISETTRAFHACGVYLYNEIILATSISTLSLRAGNYLKENRKVGKAHQNVLVFYKGDPKDIHKHFKELDFSQQDIPTDGLSESEEPLQL